MGKHYTVIINSDIPDEYLTILSERMIAEQYAKEWEVKSKSYKNIMIEAKDILWDKLTEELEFIRQARGGSQEFHEGYQILIRGWEDDFNFHEYIFAGGKLLKKRT